MDANKDSCNTDFTFCSIPLEVTTDAPKDRIVVHPCHLEAFENLALKTLKTELPHGIGKAMDITLFGIPVRLDKTNGCIVMSEETWFKIEALLTAEVTALKAHTQKFLQLLAEKR